MKYYNEEQYQDWEFDPMYCTPQFPCDKKNKFLMKGNKRVRIIDFNDNIKIEKADITNPKKKFYMYDKRTKNLLLAGQTFYSMEIGKWNYYDKLGKSIKELDMDESFPFSIENLIKKLKTEYNIDLLDVSKKIIVSRGEVNNQSYYEILIPIIPAIQGEYEFKKYNIDGKTGETLLDTISIVPDKTNPNWKQENEKKNNRQNKSVSFLAEPGEKGDYQKPELGVAYTSTSHLPKDTYQIYEGRAYTKAEWQEFRKSLPWWQRLI